MMPVNWFTGVINITLCSEEDHMGNGCNSSSLLQAW